LENLLFTSRERWFSILKWSLTKKILVGGSVFIVFISGLIIFIGSGNDLALDSATKEIVETIDSSDKSLLKDILQDQSPVASAMLFVGSLENRIAGALGVKGQLVSSWGGPEEDSDLNKLETAAGNALVAQSSVLSIIPASGSVSFDGGNYLTYEIEDGDTIESIAGDFGVSVDTLLNANGLPKGTKLKTGDKLAILPIDGVKHIVKSGDTIKSIALKYNADADRILAFNDLPDNALIKPGDFLVIPGGEFHVPLNSKVAPVNTPAPQSLPNLAGYFGLPSGGRVTYGLHRYNAIDIGGKDWCNTPLYAAAAGTVILADTQGWNGGYGRYIKIAHNNGTITLYAHASQILISQGQYVNKGQTIGLMGSTGNSTGCHVHFEVRGAKNPLAK
jgi:LysM repeat protein